MALNRKERRTQAKNERKASFQWARFVMQGDGRELTPWQEHDLKWFVEHPDCSYRLRKPFPGEYEPQEIPPSGVWLSLVKIQRHTGVTGISRVEQCPLSPSPADGLNCLMAAQATVKGQEALRVIWDDYPREVFSA